MIAKVYDATIFFLLQTVNRHRTQMVRMSKLAANTIVYIIKLILYIMFSLKK